MPFWDIKFLTEHWQLLLDLLLRLLVAGACGSVVGFERSKRLKEAGLRTHCVVAMATALIMIISKYAFVDLFMEGALAEFVDANKVDAARLAAAAIGGIGFIGAGVVVFKNGNVVRGITTAAGIYATAAIGLTIGSGMYIIGILTTALIMLIQFFMHKFPVGNDTYNTNEIVITMLDTEQSRTMFGEYIKSKRALLVGSRAFIDENGDRIFQVTIKASGSFSPENMLEMMDQYPDIRSINM